MLQRATKHRPLRAWAGLGEPGNGANHRRRLLQNLSKNGSAWQNVLMTGQRHGSGMAVAGKFADNFPGRKVFVFTVDDSLSSCDGRDVNCLQLDRSSRSIPTLSTAVPN